MLHAALEAGLDAALQRQLARKTEAARQARRGQFPRQLEQRERVAAGLGKDPPSHALIKRRADDRGEQLTCVPVRQAPEMQIRQPRQPVELERSAHGEHEPDRVSSQPPRDERKHQCRGPIQPLGVIDETQKWQLLGGLGEQAEHRETDQETIGLGARAQAEGSRERVPLWGRQPLEMVQQWPAQLMQTRKRELHLRFHPDRADNPKSVGALGGVVQEGGLSRPRRAVQNQHRTLLRHRLGKELVKPRTLLLTAD